MIKSVVTEENLLQYLEYINQNHSDNYIQLHGDIVYKDGDLFSGTFENINGVIYSLSANNESSLFVERDVIDYTNLDLFNEPDTSNIPSILRVTAGNYLSATNATLNLKNIPTSPVNLEQGTLYMSGGRLRFV
jgi:hypothetical protein